MKENYLQDQSNKTFNALIMGDYGSGKTTLAMTCPKPVLMHVFDPGGYKVALLKPFIEKGDIIVKRYDIEDPRNPSAFKQWEKDMDELRAAGVFSHIKTFILDSLTTFCDALMNEILRRGNRAGTIPQIQDYLVQQNTIRDWVHIISSLPCHFIATGHISVDKDELTGRILTGLLASGKISLKLPLLFDEVYIAQAKKGEKNQVTYQLLTGTDGLYRGRTRIGAGRFELFEKSDISHLLAKAGL